MKFHRLLLLLFGLTVFAGTAMAAPESATPPEEPAGVSTWQCTTMQKL